MAAGPRRDAPWGTDFDPDQLARLEPRMWKAYYRRQPARLFGLLVLALREQARRLVAAGARGEPAPDQGRGRVRPGDRRLRALRPGHRPAATGCSACPADVDVEAVARDELRWWVVRREIGLAAGAAAGDAITRLYAALYDVPLETVARPAVCAALAAEVRDRGATDDPDGPTGPATAYWPEVARLLRESYRS